MTKREQLLIILADMPAVQTLPKMADHLISHGVIVAKRGYWIKTGNYVCGDYEFQCSSCGETRWEGESYDKHAHYCLNCGAKMDGGKNEA